MKGTIVGELGVDRPSDISDTKWFTMFMKLEWSFRVWMGITVASRLSVRWSAKFAIVSRFVNITTMVLIASVAVVVDSLWELFKGISIRNFNTIMIALLIHRIEKVAKNVDLSLSGKQFSFSKFHFFFGF